MTPTPLARWRVVYIDTKGITHFWHTYPRAADAIADANHLSAMTIVVSTKIIELTDKEVTDARG